jgi:hypothetical protein
MNPATIDSLQAGQQLTFTLVDASGNNVPGTVTMDVTNTVATFTPTAPSSHSEHRLCRHSLDCGRQRWWHCDGQSSHLELYD